MEERRKAILAVTRMQPGDQDKGLELCLRAFARVRDGHPDWTLEIAGEGSERPRFEKAAKKLGLGAQVRFHGAVDDETLKGLYRQCRLFCLPSTKEGFGIVYIEAMLHGLPVLAVRATAVPEVVGDGVSGLLSKPGDMDGLAANMDRLLSNAPLLDALSSGALEDARRFSFPVFQSRVEALLDELLEARR